MGFLHRTLAKQLGDPSGLLGSLVVGNLNKRNYPTNAGAVEALGPMDGEIVADIGYGGGIGLKLLLDAVGETGRVHGVDPSPSMVRRSMKEYAEHVAGHRLALHEAAMEALPFGDGELGGWISLNTIYFIDDLATSFAELARVTGATGRGVLGVADPDWLASQPFAQHGFTVRPLDDVLGALTGAGLAPTVKPITDPESATSYNLILCTH